jgi:hypothetical protein
VRGLGDAFYLRKPAGSYDPFIDRFFAIASLEPRLPTGIGMYLDVAADDLKLFPQF